MLTVLHEARKGPWTPISWVRAVRSPSQNPRPRRRGLRGNIVPFPAALCAAGTPMGWTLVAPFLELPPSCAALAALANRARPAVRCRTAFPQKCRDCGGADRPPQAQLAKSPRPRPWRKLSSPSAGEPRFPAEARKTIPQDAAAPRITKAP